MMPVQWLLRAAHWARRPPPLSRVWLVLAVVLLCAALAGLERFELWPDWMRSEGGIRRPLR